MPEKRKFVDAVIRNLKPKKTRTIYWCEDSPGFGLRITPSGTKSFVFKYMAGRTSRWITLGQYPKISLREARIEYEALYERVNEYGKDPVFEEQTKKTREQPFAALIDEYLELGRLKGKKFVHEEERYLATDVLPVIGNKPLQEITIEDIDRIQKNIVIRSSKRANATQSGRVTAKHVIGCARRVLDLACRKGLIDHNPAKNIEPLGIKGKRERVLDFREIWLLWNKMDECNVPPVTGNAIRFMLTTMQRGIEVRNCRYSAIKADENIWHMTSGDTKSGRMHRVPLNSLALSLIQSATPYTSACPFVFGATRAAIIPDTPSAALKPSTSSSYQQAMRRVRNQLGIHDIRPHDLRRTGATWITAVGLPKLYARLMLNHSDGDRDVTGEVYIQYGYDFEKRKAAEVWGFVLNKIVTCASPEEVPSLDEIRVLVRESGLLS
ncbi:site-specific integrase [uncultured Paraglaciecola sp.]|uniref:tyrosine-type recombinase/integrase n=1 Tax=uncultured Paraglaciecola sp. TaxID=1765024 RepID=UPI002617301E|nr:site-specific integrase [uncultured Paraglaciecola sp.]